MSAAGSDRSCILVLGAGSIGRRHATNLAAAGARVLVTDPDAARAAEVADAAVDPDAAAIETIAFDLDALPAVDGIVVASPTRHHLDHARRAVDHGVRVLVEKPLAERSAEVADLVDRAGDQLMVGYNLRLHAPIARLVEGVRAGRVGRPLSYRLWFGSFLPDWRPDVDYRATYSARADLGGGVLNDAIHELDLAVWLAGPDLTVRGALVARLGGLEIDVEDTVRALLTTPDGVPVELALDYLSRTYRRGIEVIGSEATLRLDWARATLETEAADTPVAESYVREAEAFLRFVRDGTPPPVDGAAGLASLRLADAIRAAGGQDVAGVTGNDPS
jgi:predicted dehydrogenase